MCGEPKIRHCRESNIGDVETRLPGFLILVLEVKLQEAFLKVNQAEFSGYGSSADATCGTASDFLVFTVIPVIVRRLTIT